MKKLLPAIIFNLFFISSYSQETLQSVTDRGATTTNLLNVHKNTSSSPVNLFTDAIKVGGSYSNYPSLTLGLKGEYDSYISTYGNDLHILAGKGVATENHSINFYTGFKGSNGQAENNLRLKVDYNGNVGIGSSTPAAKLHLQGYSGLAMVLRGGTTVGANYFQFENVNGELQSYVGHGSYGSTDFFYYLPQSSFHRFFSNGQERMTIDPDGNVGIGKSDTKGYKLAVSGAMIAESIKVKLQGSWPDFVFEPSYKHTSLTELEQFIQTNKHLPEIPSAKEVEESGINLGEMNVKLLKKIEELTLHLIEKDKELKESKKRMDEFERKLNQLLQDK